LRGPAGPASTAVLIDQLRANSRDALSVTLLHLLAGCADGCGIAAMATPVAVSYAALPVGVGGGR
jgi:hypothetical protein